MASAPSSQQFAFGQAIRNSESEAGAFSSVASQWTKRSFFSLTDQALTAGAGFGANVLLARWLPKDEYGTFAIIFAAYLFVVGFHNVLVSEPLSVFGPAIPIGKIGDYFRSQLRIHFLLTCLLSAVTLLACGLAAELGVGRQLLDPIVACAISGPFLLLLWITRRMCYCVNRVDVVARASGIFLASIFASLLLAHHYLYVSPAVAFFLMAGCSLISAAFILYSLSSVVGSFFGKSLSVMKIASENWNYGRWMLGSAILFAACGQIQIILAGGLIGLEAAGALRAMQLPSLIVTQVITAASLVFLPRLSFDFSQRGFSSIRVKGLLLSAALAVAAIFVFVVLFLFRNSLEALIFHAKYHSYSALIPLLACIPICSGLSTGMSLALRAARQPRYDLISNAVAAPIGIVATLIFIHYEGVLGAALGMVLATATLSIATLGCFVSFSRQQKTEVPITSQGNRRPFQFLKTLRRIARADHTNRLKSFSKHLRWQLRKLNGDFPCEVTIAESRLRVYEPTGVGSLVNALGEYDANNMALLRAVLRDGTTFIDVGANIGSYTLLASQSKSTRVVSIEPHPRTFERLTENVKLNARKNVICLNIAISRSIGAVCMTDLKDSSLNQLVYPETLRSQPENTVIVRSQTLESVCKGLFLLPKIIKIDVEGHELEVLRGLRSLDRCVQLFLVEGGERKEIVDWMCGREYSGPFYFHAARRCFSRAPQRQEEDPIFVNPAYLEILRKMQCNILEFRK